ncbi:hypothetical protein CLV46_2843 [Diaminobutyricimonas aerilata]|uniref:Uncharacterized protein n=1 Tax=Diaminobutyricimonas aerilata TaxID=1162967 RepID=A0A2M9CMX5_9MICO|nr:hypothetical protein [Diaminobutyricimonas aerilata]PJJ73257.1 hypothetical protein CLV46_2843 [Diaminobutyricimonas aerilata]
MSGTSYEYSLIFPPGWGRFRPNQEAERHVVHNLTEAFAASGDMRALTRFRALVHTSFEELRRRGAVAVHVPTETVEGVALPASVSVLPAPFRSEEDAARFEAALTARGATVKVGEEGTARIVRWEERTDHAAGEQGVSALSVGYVFPAPDGSRLRPAVVAGSILYPTGDEENELTRSLLALIDAVAGTFTWRRSE